MLYGGMNQKPLQLCAVGCVYAIRELPYSGYIMYAMLLLGWLLTVRHFGAACYTALKCGQPGLSHARAGSAPFPAFLKSAFPTWTLTMQVIRRHQQLQTQLWRYLHIRHIFRILILQIVIKILADFLEYNPAVSDQQLTKLGRYKSSSYLIVPNEQRPELASAKLPAILTLISS